jgi:hypothetical protein
MSGYRAPRPGRWPVSRSSRLTTTPPTIVALNPCCVSVRSRPCPNRQDGPAGLPFPASHMSCVDGTALHRGPSPNTPRTRALIPSESGPPNLAAETIRENGASTHPISRSPVRFRRARRPKPRELAPISRPTARIHAPSLRFRTTWRREWDSNHDRKGGEREIRASPLHTTTLAYQFRRIASLHGPGGGPSEAFGLGGI